MSEKKEIKKTMSNPDIEKRNTPNRVLPTSTKPKPVPSSKPISHKK